MSKTWLCLLLLLAICACNQSAPIETPPCDPVVSENGNVRKVFKDCRTLVYNARYWDWEFNLLSEERITVTATGRPWDQQPELQDEIIIQYERGPEWRDQLRPHVPNPTFDNWSTTEVTGIIEDGRRVWMHPFRSNQYSFTEVAGFPEISLPITGRAKWTKTLNIYDGWGDWANTALTTFYSILGQEEVDIPIGPMDAWHVRANTEASFGTSTHDFWFHEEYGFVKMVIKNYMGQLVAFELVEVIEGS